MEDKSMLLGKICFIIVLFVMIYGFFGDVAFRIKYSFPKVSEISKKTIDIQKDPMQLDYKRGRAIMINGEKYRYSLSPRASYVISGIVITKNTNFWLRGFFKNRFDDICLLDLGIVWGDIADKKFLKKNFKFKSTKTLGEARRLTYMWRSDVPYSQNYITSHISHTHIIPATINVMGGMLTIKKWDKVRLEGYLVDIYTDKAEPVSKTSMSRSDNDYESFAQGGNGACEVMYVVEAQIGDKIYK
jgi:hypothetical protein